MKDNFQDSVEDNLNALVAVGTLMNQLGRLDPDDILQKDAVETVRTALTQLFKDYIEEQQPEENPHKPTDETHYADVNNEPPDCCLRVEGYNQALQQYKSNLLEGLE